MSSAPQGWYRDPHHVARFRWWDGTAWTEGTRGNAGAVARLLRESPFKRWIPIATAIVVVGVVLFGRAESTRTQDPAGWYGAGFASVAAIVLVAACITLAGRRWLEVLVFAALTAVAVTLAVFIVTAPSTSRSCSNEGRPKSAGTYECDTSYGLGAPFLAVAFAIPAAGLAAVGKFAGDTYYSVREHITRRPSGEKSSP
jgi:hypothetical protein